MVKSGVMNNNVNGGTMIITFFKIVSFIVFLKVCLTWANHGKTKLDGDL